jgi:hypothetical protein
MSRAAGPFTPRIARMVTHSEMWHRYVPESGNWHDGTFTRWIAALSAAPNPFYHKKFSLRHPCHEASRPLFAGEDWTFDESLVNGNQQS